MPKAFLISPCCRSFVAGFAILMIGSSVSWAVDWTEDGGTDNWSDSNNWSGSVPGSSSTVIFSSDEGPRTQFVDFDVITTVRNVYVQDSSGFGGFAFVDVFTTLDGGASTVLNITNQLRLRGSSGVTDTGRASLVLKDMNVFPGSIAIENGGPEGVGEKFLRLTDSQLVTDMSSNINASKFEIVLEDGSLLANTGSGELRLRSGSSLELADGSSLDWNLELDETLSVQAGGGRLVAAAELDGPVQLNGSTAELRFGDPSATPGGSSKTAQIDGSVSGTGKIVVDDPNYTVRLNAGNTFTGGLVLKAGEAVAASGSRLGGINNRLFFEGGTLRTSSSFNISIESTINSGGINNISSLGVTGDFHGSASGVFTKSGVGMLTLNNDNGGFLGSYVVERGTLVSNNGDSFSNSSTVEILSGATLRFDGAENFDGLSGEGAVQVNGQTLRLGKNNTTGNDFSGQLVGSGTIIKDGTGSQRFSGDNSGFSGTFQLTDGSLIFEKGENLGQDLFVPSGSNVQFDPESGESDYTHALSGTGSFAKLGAGTLNVTGDSLSYSGYFFVGEGRVNIDGSFGAGGAGGAGGQEVAVVEGGTVGGNGVINTRLYAEPNSTISPGRSVGILTAEEYRMDAGAVLSIELAGDGDVAGTDYDQLSIIGDAQINDAELAVSQIEGFVPSHGDAFEVLDIGGALTGTGFTEFDLPALPGMRWDTSQLAAAGVISIEVLLPGDYNLDGTVDAADYTVWRDSLGESAGALPSDTDGGTIGQAQYDTWVARFGQSLPNPAAALPEPAAIAILVGFLASAGGWGQRRQP